MNARPLGFPQRRTSSGVRPPLDELAHRRIATPVACASLLENRCHECEGVLVLVLGSAAPPSPLHALTSHPQGTGDVSLSEGDKREACRRLTANKLRRDFSERRVEVLVEHAVVGVANTQPCCQVFMRTTKSVSPSVYHSQREADAPVDGRRTWKSAPPRRVGAPSLCARPAILVEVWRAWCRRRE